MSPQGSEARLKEAPPPRTINQASRKARRAPLGTLGTIASIVIILAAMKAASGLVSQTLLGVVLAVAALPIHEAVRKRGWSSFLGAVLASATLLVVAAGIGVLLTYAGSQFAEEIPRFRQAVATGQSNLQTWLEAQDLGSMSAFLNNGLDLSRVEVLPRIVDAATSLGSLGFVLFVALFTLFEAPTFEDKWNRVTHTDLVTRAHAGKVLLDVQRYLTVKTGTCLATGILVGVWTGFLGLQGAVLWGIFAYVLNYIPVIGSLVAGIPPTVIGLMTIDVLTGSAVGIGILLINLLIGNGLEPRIMGRAMGLSPLVVLLSVALWGFILGPVGALLSVPLTVIAKLILEQSDRYGWVAVLLESPATLHAEAQATADLGKHKDG